MTDRPAPRPPLIDDELDGPDLDVLEDDDEIEASQLTGSDWSATAASHVRIVGSRLQAVRLTAAELPHLQLHDVVLDDCDLSGARMERAVLRRVRLQRCRLPGAVLSEANIEDVEFDGCAMTGVSLYRAKAERLVLRDCRLEEADLSQATLPGTRFDHSNLARAQITGAVLKGASFAGAELSGLRGVASLAGASISSTHVVPIGERFIVEAGITVDDEAGWAGG